MDRCDYDDNCKGYFGKKSDPSYWELATTSACSNDVQKHDVGNDGPLVRDGDCGDSLGRCFIKKGKTKKIYIRKT